jgi:hypothetical protein
MGSSECQVETVLAHKKKQGQRRVMKGKYPINCLGHEDLGQ